MKVNVIYRGEKMFEKQLSPKWKKEGCEFFFNSHEDVVWDAVFVLENLDQYFRLKCRRGGIFSSPENRQWLKSILKLF